VFPWGGSFSVVFVSSTAGVCNAHVSDGDFK
jgi:hypothetical protein